MLTTLTRLTSKTMRIAVEGCCHGELDKIFAAVRQSEEATGTPVDLLLICGDFQAIRNKSDLLCLAVPEKYRQLGQFYKYYSGQAEPPCLTIVIGGNHEASNYMHELYHGGWLTPSIYYLGAAGSVLVNGLRVSGASGIYKDQHYNMGRFETLPYDQSMIRSIYHTRRFDIERLAQLKNKEVAFFLSHDWPLSIERHGDLQYLLHRKPFFKQEVETNSLGSPPLLHLLKTLKPTYWFSAHLHVKFAALYKHDGTSTIVASRSRHRPPIEEEKNPDELEIDIDEDAAPAANPDELQLDVDEDDAPAANPDELEIDIEDDATIEQQQRPPDVLDLEEAKRAALAAILGSSADTQTQTQTETEPDEKPQSLAPSPPSPNETRFLALSKLVGRHDEFMQFLDVEAPDTFSPPKIMFDPQWLAITRAYHASFSVNTRQQRDMPNDPDTAVSKELEWIKANLPEGGNIPVHHIQQFTKTAPAPDDEGGDSTELPKPYSNPQTEALMRWLQLDNKINT